MKLCFDGEPRKLLRLGDDEDTDLDFRDEEVKKRELEKKKTEETNGNETNQ